ncbi:MAG: DNA-directed RNA polymerase subunit D [Candidatus Bilamarchaeaceae archaeon]
MELTLSKKHENRIEFIAKDISNYFANMLRRYSMVKVPVLAIEKVEFYENTSAFWDEYIAHRLGLMPINTPKKIVNEEVTFYLDFEGPGIAYAKDMKSSDKDIYVAKENIPIITLGEKQRVRFEAKTALNRGTKHAKYQSGLVSYGIKNDSFNFFVESFYHMPPAEVILRACDEIKTEINEIKKALK